MRRFLTAPARQEILFAKAVREQEGVFDENSYQMDHLMGTNSYHGKTYGIKLPADPYYVKSPITLQEREIDVFFEGFVDRAGGRKELLEPFMTLPNSHIRFSNFGRKPLLKSFSGPGYLKRMRQSRFVLCPQHVNWPGPPLHAWTYRFAEAVLSGGLPVIFPDAPLGQSFLGDFRFIESQDLFEVLINSDWGTLNDLAIHNHKLSREFLFGSTDELAN